jgi:hypothetical protein
VTYFADVLLSVFLMSDDEDRRSESSDEDDNNESEVFQRMSDFERGSFRGYLMRS